ncbi:MAG: hypothetical protein KDJ52_14520 [Anaerolineae bacterium]|nr:hypothetical protein [Anaerolineae bacterium]
MELYPALLIGGPPHSGKSVLAYSLTQAFRQLGLQHYLLRSCPDGEGDWANESDQGLVRLIRVKGQYTPTWVEKIGRDIARRHLPLLVDVGGKPKPEQESIFGHCTHAVLIAPTAEALIEWRGYARRHGLTVLAELESSLTEEAAVFEEGPIFKARLHGLERGTTQHNPVFQQLVDKLTPYFTYPSQEIRQYHLNTDLVETVIDLEQLARTLDVPHKGEQAFWEPKHIPPLLNELPDDVSLGLYGRGPNWLYAAVAVHCRAAPFYQFDPRLGWVEPVTLRLGTLPKDAPIICLPYEARNLAIYSFGLRYDYLDYLEADGLTVPAPPTDKPLILNGKIPHWLLTGLSHQYQSAPLLAVHQPQLEQNVVVSSRLPEFVPGDLCGPRL